ncbi:hypothetical protein FGKAn22_02170 [Ferrigenium kumadai]|uniref:Uncharacterized protein n=1 Tax=Ferrigenium kumadai TaxID=1682490 RepID=A0AAN1VYS3_9PROT|nr:hypothetical protein [Ferrigenium kumadai]BBI98524.1 hypothetical protein FGKAn22_02170 [Ferrigenium kumadai]
MKKIAAIALLSAIVPVPVYAVDDNAYVSIKADDEALNTPAYETRRLIVERLEKLSKFSLVEVSDNFSLYGKLSFPRIKSSDADNVIQRDAPTYGLHAQFNSPLRIGIRFGWDRYIAGQNANGNLYSLTAAVKF